MALACCVRHRTARIKVPPTNRRNGMAVTVEIKTGQRRAIDYLLSPLHEIASGAGHER